MSGEPQGTSGTSVTAVAGPPTDPQYFDEAKVLQPPLRKEDAIRVEKTTPEDLPDPREVGAEFEKTATIWAVRMDRDFTVETLEGTHKGKAGDWLAKGVKGELWPIDAEVFERTYRPVEECPLCPGAGHQPPTTDEGRAMHLLFHEAREVRRLAEPVLAEIMLEGIANRAARDRAHPTRLPP